VSQAVFAMSALGTHVCEWAVCYAIGLLSHVPCCSRGHHISVSCFTSSVPWIFVWIMKEIC